MRHDTTRKPQNIMKQENTRQQRITRTWPAVTTNTRCTMRGKRPRRMSKITGRPYRRTPSLLRRRASNPPGFAEPQAALEGSFKIATQVTGAYSSTAQDMMRGKRTEIDSLNGYIVRRGAELGVPTPIHQALYTLVKLAEGET
jgi:hypothetical protein